MYHFKREEHDKAITWLTSASKMGDMQALFQLAIMHYDGIGTLANLVSSGIPHTCACNMLGGGFQKVERAGEDVLRPIRDMRMVKLHPFSSVPCVFSTYYNNILFSDERSGASKDGG